MTTRHVIGLGLVAGVGFTVSIAIFVAGLAFTEPALVEDSKLGVLVGSCIAAIAATIVLRRACRVSADGDHGPA